MQLAEGFELPELAPPSRGEICISFLPEELPFGRAKPGAAAWPAAAGGAGGRPGAASESPLRQRCGKARASTPSARTEGVPGLARRVPAGRAWGRTAKKERGNRLTSLPPEPLSALPLPPSPGFLPSPPSPAWLCPGLQAAPPSALHPSSIPLPTLPCSAFTWECDLAL